jgi:hypothetical protein
MTLIIDLTPPRDSDIQEEINNFFIFSRCFSMGDKRSQEGGGNLDVPPERQLVPWSQFRFLKAARIRDDLRHQGTAWPSAACRAKAAGLEGTLAEDAAPVAGGAAGAATGYGAYRRPLLRPTGAR